MAFSYAAVFVLTFTLCLGLEIEKSDDEIPMVDYAMDTVYHYKYHTFTEINEPHVPYVTNNSLNYVGQKINADIRVTKVFDDSVDSVLEVKFDSPILTNVAHEVSKPLTSLSENSFFVHSKEDKVRRIFTFKGNDKMTNNYIRGVASMFTLQAVLGRYTEYDSAGKCSTKYTSLRKHNKSIEKKKIKCDTDPTSEINQALGVHVETERTASYLLSTVANRSIIGAVVSAEIFHNQVGLEATIGSQVHVQQEFEFKTSESGQTDRKVENLSDLEKQLEKEQYVSIEVVSETFPVERKVKPMDAVLKEGRDLLVADYVGRSTDATRIFLDLVEAIRGESDESVLKQMLTSPKNKAILPTIIDALVASQTSQSVSSLASFIKFDSADDTVNAERYLLSTSFVAKPRTETVEFLMNLFSKKLPSSKVKDMVSLTLGAVIYTYSAKEKRTNPIFKQFESLINNAFVSCGLDTPCRLQLLGAIENSGRSKFIDLLLRLVDSENSELREAALMAFKRINVVYERSVENSMFAIYANLHQADNTATTRLLALNVLLKVGIDEKLVYDVLKNALCPRNKEFNLMVRNVLNVHAKSEPLFEKLLNKAMKKVHIYKYMMMMKNTSGISFTSVLATTRSGRMDYNMYVHNTEGGAMVRSGLDVLTSGNDHYQPIYKFGLYTEGLDSMLGDKNAPASDIEPSAGMRLQIQGITLRPVRFFTGNSAMVSAVWSAPADLTSALQLNVLVQDFNHTYLMANGMVGQVVSMGAMSLDVSASLAVSLWNKNSKSLIRNSASVSLRGELYMGPKSVGVSYSGHAKGQIDFKTDVDFSADTKMCLQMEQPNFDFSLNIEKFERHVKPGKKFSSKRQESLVDQGKSLPLPKINYRMCADMKQ